MHCGKILLLMSVQGQSRRIHTFATLLACPTMILIGYRHGLRASELCDLQWSQVELATGRLHVRRAKNGSPSVHPMQGDETRCDACNANRGYPRTSS